MGQSGGTWPWVSSVGHGHRSVWWDMAIVHLVGHGHSSVWWDMAIVQSGGTWP